MSDTITTTEISRTQSRHSKSVLVTEIGSSTSLLRNFRSLPRRHVTFSAIERKIIVTLILFIHDSPRGLNRAELATECGYAINDIRIALRTLPKRLSAAGFRYPLIAEPAPHCGHPIIHYRFDIEA